MGQIAVAIPGEHIAIATDPWTEPFWNKAKEGKLTAAQCASCGRFRLPPTPFCPKCRSQETRWPDLPGTGTVFSFVICPRSPFPDVPDFTYVPVIVDLDGTQGEGARMVTNLIDVDTDTVKIGMKVKVDFVPIQDGWMLPVFRAA